MSRRRRNERKREGEGTVSEENEEINKTDGEIRAKRERKAE